MAPKEVCTGKICTGKIKCRPQKRFFALNAQTLAEELKSSTRSIFNCCGTDGATKNRGLYRGRGGL